MTTPESTPTYPQAVCRMTAAEEALARTTEALDSMRSGFELIYAMGKWMADRVPELAAAAQHAAMAEIGFTSAERHEGMTFGRAYGDWKAICSCGWVGDVEQSIAYARSTHEQHVREVLG